MKKLLLSFLPVLVALVLVVSPSVGFGQATDDDVQNALNQLRQSRQAFKDAKAQEKNEQAEVGKAKGQAQREAAEQKREQAQQRMEDKRKEVLLKLVDIQIKHFTRTEARVSRMPKITDELRAQLIAEIDTTIQNLNGLKTKVDAATGKEAIKELAKEIRDFSKSQHEIVKKIVDAIHASRANIAVVKAEERAAAIKDKVQNLKDKGKNTAETEAELEDAEKDINDAQEAIGRKAFKEANEDLQGAYQKFRNIAQKAKNL